MEKIKEKVMGAGQPIAASKPSYNQKKSSIKENDMIKIEEFTMSNAKVSEKDFLPL